MTHTSPTTFAVWSVLSFSLGAFLLGHLWRFDKFKCLKWSNAPYSGAFKRIMTYTYLITIPLIMTYSFGFTFIKYKEGFVDLAGTIVPKPYILWSKGYRDAIFPLMMVFSFAWSFEMVTHLEELCFWYFLITAGPAQPDWFRSPYFRIWIAGSVAAMVYVPAVTIAYRDDPLGCEARMFTAGSVGDLILTLAFIPILFRFPGFIQKVKAEGVDSAIIVRLRKFYELNVIRIIFRFLMQIPLFTLGVDGLKPHHHINESLFWTDLLSTVAALGCVFSSVCTLLIFFPRSYEAEYQAKELSHRHSVPSLSSRQSREPQPAYSQYGEDDRQVFEPSSLGKSTSFNAYKLSGNDLYEDDLVKFDRTERKMGTGLVRERLGSKIREHERRIARSTKRVGAGIHDALTRQFMRFSAQRRRYPDPEGSSGISLTPGIPSLAREEQNAKDEKDAVTRRTTPSARAAARKGSDSTAMMSEEGRDPTLQRKGTYLLTNSPVARSRRMEQEMEGTGPTGAISAETLEAACVAGAGKGAFAGITTSPVVDANEIEITYHPEHCLSTAQSQDNLRETHQIQEDDDVPTFALDSPPPPVSAAPSYSHATRPDNSCPQGQIYGPRPIKKSLSLSTTATVTTRRALPTPPICDPLGAAPAYSPPREDTFVPLQIQEESLNREDNRGADIGEDVTAGLRTHPFASASASASATALDPQTALSDTHPEYMREHNDAQPVTIAVQTGTGRAQHSVGSRQGLNLTSPRSRAGLSNNTDAADLEGGHVERLPRGRVFGLTAANLSRLNSTPRTSQVNPLVRTFTSPIDFLDRIQENPGSGSGSAPGNASRTQIGWAV